MISPDVPGECSRTRRLIPRESTEAEFATEVAPEGGRGHPLYGLPEVVVGRGVSQDDVGF